MAIKKILKLEERKNLVETIDRDTKKLVREDTPKRTGPISYDLRIIEYYIPYTLPI